MYKNKAFIFLSFLSFSLLCNFFSSCNDDNVITPAETNSIVFKGITSTDNNGWIISNDPDDWKLSETWNDKENALFVEKKATSCDNGNSDYIIHPCYLNPCINQFTLGFVKPAESRFVFRVVDRNYNVLLSNDSVFSSVIAINVQSFNIKNDTVRMYYKFLGQDCELKGHGDIKIE